jgi:hypothetical protein
MVYRLNRSLAINCEYIGNNMKSLVLWVNSLDMEFLIVEYFICFQTYSKCVTFMNTALTLVYQKFNSSRLINQLPTKS